MNSYAERLPMAGRKMYGLKTVCTFCHSSIVDDFFVLALEPGARNQILHEACAQKQGIVAREPIIEVQKP